VTLAGDLAVAAIGSEGVQVVDLRAQSSVAHVPMPTDTGYDPEDVATNAVSVEGDLLVASGGGVGVGLIRADRPLAAVAEGEGVALTPLGRADLPGSVNHSTLRGESIFVAAGAAGFAVLRLE
jgi:hypothetical protein